MESQHVSHNHPLIGLGFCCWDHVCLVPDIPRDGKVEILASLQQGGGPAATAIFAAQRLGTSTGFLGVVGDDESGDRILREFQAEGVDTSGMKRRAGASSATGYCWASQKTGERSIAWSRGSAVPLLSEEIEAAVSGCRVLHLDGHQTVAALHAASVVRPHGATVCLDAGTLHPGMAGLLEKVDIVIASESFARDFTGEHSLESALRRLRVPGVRWAVVTSGEKGSLGWDGDEIVRLPAFPVPVVDTSGAGDVYHGAFLHRFLQGGDLRDCMIWGAGAAAMKCTQPGGRTGAPTADRLEDFLEHNKHIIK